MSTSIELTNIFDCMCGLVFQVPYIAQWVVGSVFFKTTTALGNKPCVYRYALTVTIFYLLVSVANLRARRGPPTSYTSINL